MFYKVTLSDHIRVPPALFSLPLEEAIAARIKKKYDGYISAELGIVIDLADISEVGEGVLIPGDGGPFYEAKFSLYVYKPELQEVVLGRVRDVADFGAFMNLGPIDGMVHISQTMDDFVSFSKDKVLVGKDSKHTLKVGDRCRARMIAVSFKDVTNPKLGLTMRQPGLGKLEWLEEESGKDSKGEK
ncbi:DNA-directed RNA polymerase [Candidatus Woesearchaeota archaeon]|nr:DNA-directed RNA polymerase [Candidatus Woesearchaeota archaeon]